MSESTQRGLKKLREDRNLGWEFRPLKFLNTRFFEVRGEIIIIWYGLSFMVKDTARVLDPLFNSTLSQGWDQKTQTHRERSSSPYSAVVLWVSVCTLHRHTHTHTRPLSEGTYSFIIWCLRASEVSNKMCLCRKWECLWLSFFLLSASRHLHFMLFLIIYIFRAKKRERESEIERISSGAFADFWCRAALCLWNIMHI